MEWASRCSLERVIQGRALAGHHPPPFCSIEPLIERCRDVVVAVGHRRDAALLYRDRLALPGSSSEPKELGDRVAGSRPRLLPSASPTSISYYASTVETIKGTPVTEADIQDWADEAERGYEVEQLRKRGRKTIGDGPARVVPVRIDAALLAALTERAERDHISRSEAIRSAIRSYVA